MRKAKPILFAILAASAILGCAAPPDRATVKGTVSYQGKPVPYGFISFANAKIPATFDEAPIRADGTYVLTNAPIGPVKVLLKINMAYDPQALAAKGEKPPEDLLPAELADKYREIESTPLAREVRLGEQTMDFEIK